MIATKPVFYHSQPDLQNYIYIYKMRGNCTFIGKELCYNPHVFWLLPIANCMTIWSTKSMLDFQRLILKLTTTCASRCLVMSAMFLMNKNKQHGTNLVKRKSGEEESRLEDFYFAWTRLEKKLRLGIRWRAIQLPK